MAANKTLNLAIDVTGNAVPKLNQITQKLKHIGKFKASTNVAKFDDSLKSAGLNMDQLGNITQTGTTKVVQLDKAVQAVGKSMGGLNKRASTFDMRLLSLLFGGMALKRAFGGILRSIFDTFTRAEDKTSGLSMVTTRLSASWEFLKFSIMDALNVDWFIGFIDGVINVINWFSQLDDGWKITFLSITTGLFIIGTGLMLIGQTKLGWDAIFGMGGFLRGTNTIHSKTLGPSGVLTKLKNFALVGLSLKMLFDLSSYLEGEKDLKTLLDDFGTALSLIGLVSKTPWVIAVGVLLKLLPFGEQIKEFGTSIVESGFGRTQRGINLSKKTVLEDPKSIFSSIPFLLGGLESGVGAIIGGLGEMLIDVNSYVEKIDKGTESTDILADTLSETLAQDVLDISDKIDGEEGSLNNALKKTSEEMDILSGEKTVGFNIATDSRIAKIEEEITAEEKLARVQSNRLFAFQSTANDYYSSSVSND